MQTTTFKCLLFVCLFGLASCAATDPAHCKRPKNKASKSLVYKR
jgi:hypothetical protein